MGYVAETGLDYTVDGKPRHADPGDLVEDLPEESVDWLLECGAVSDPNPAAPEALASEAPVVNAKATLTPVPRSSENPLNPFILPEDGEKK